MKKGSILQEDITILSVYMPNNSIKINESNLDRTIGEIDKSTVVVGDFNSLVSEVDRSSMQKCCKEIVEPSNTSNQLNVMDIFNLWTTSSIPAEYTFFSNSHGTFTKTDNILGHKTHLNKFKRIEIIQCLLFSHNGIKLEISSRKIAERFHSTWISNHF